MSVDETDGQGSGRGPRDSKGRYRKGYSGHKKGRPPSPKRPFTERQHRADFLHATEEMVSFLRNGKRGRMPAVSMINRRLIQKAVEGDVRCIITVLDRRREYLAENAAERKELAELAARAKRAFRSKPEDATDEDLETLRDIGRWLKDPYNIDWPPNKEQTRKR